jgi:hypothetical protein
MTACPPLPTTLLPSVSLCGWGGLCSIKGEPSRLSKRERYDTEIGLLAGKPRDRRLSRLRASSLESGARMGIGSTTCVKGRQPRPSGIECGIVGFGLRSLTFRDSVVFLQSWGPSHTVQDGGAYICKSAICRCARLLKCNRTRCTGR